MPHRTGACALSSIASNTGARLPGEALITCNTSAVAVCCSSASRVSVNQPRVLHRDHRLSGEVLQQRDLLVGERPHLLAEDRDDAEQRVILAQRTQIAVRAPASTAPARAERRSGTLRSRQRPGYEHTHSPSRSLQRRSGPLSPRLTSAMPPMLPATPAPRRARTRSPSIGPQTAERGPAQPDAFSSIASNTGARLPGEALITCSTSAVAVCCSSASRCSVISRAFSIAITAWSAKFCTSSICRSVNGSPRRAENDHAEHLVLAQQRHAEQGADAAERRPRSVTAYSGSAARSATVDDMAFKDGPSRHRRAAWR